MRKIRGFKLNLRVKEIQRRAKKSRVDLASLGLQSESALSSLAKEFSDRARPSVLYDSFPPEGAKSAASRQEPGASAPALAPMPGLAYSLALVTLGPDLDAYIEERTQAVPPMAAALELFSQAALEEATRFVLALLEEEAKQEHCELSPIQYAAETPALRAVVDRLEGHKIGVAVADAGIRPIRTSALGLSWLSRSKSRAK